VGGGTIGLVRLARKLQPAKRMNALASVHSADRDCALVQAPADAGRQQGTGGIVNIASRLGIRVTGTTGLYAIFQAVVIQMIKALAVEGACGSHLEPLATSRLARELGEESFETEVRPVFIGRVPQRGVSPLDEFDGPFLLLLSEAGSFVTGQRYCCQRRPSRLAPIMT
jgi:hypothetical protein